MVNDCKLKHVARIRRASPPCCHIWGRASLPPAASHAVPEAQRVQEHPPVRSVGGEKKQALNMNKDC